jgi:Zn-dependent M16 (insulinase) family peptidase
MKKLLYPSDDVGYKSNTGGKMANVRALTPEEVRNYHEKYYTPDNMMVIVIGDVDPYDIMDSLNNVNSKVDGAVRKRVKRPFSNIEAAKVSSARTSPLLVPFPSDEEEDSGTSTGQVVIGYKGGLWNDFMWKVCIQTAWEYLSGTSNSPLHASMIECDDPVCGSIDGSLEEFAVTSYTITFDNVPVDKLDQIGMVCTNGLSLLNVKFQEFQFTCHHSNLVYYNATLMNR